MAEYESAYYLIDKYFSNFPYRLISHKNYPLLLSGKYLKIPLELENKLKGYFESVGEYEFIKSDLLKAPNSFPSEFLKHYKELKEQTGELLDDDDEHFELEFD